MKRVKSGDKNELRRKGTKSKDKYHNERKRKKENAGDAGSERGYK